MCDTRRLARLGFVLSAWVLRLRAAAVLRPYGRKLPQQTLEHESELSVGVHTIGGMLGERCGRPCSRSSAKFKGLERCICALVAQQFAWLGKPVKSTLAVVSASQCRGQCPLSKDRHAICQVQPTALRRASGWIAMWQLLKPLWKPCGLYDATSTLNQAATCCAYPSRLPSFVQVFLSLAVR
jgi:hypothetical protein